jgi:hypothetical protein
VTYEWGRVLRLCAAGAVIFVLGWFFRLQPFSVVEIGLKLALLSAFALFVVKGNIVDRDDIDKIKSILFRVVPLHRERIR